ncbi:protein-tyrosine phosphatase-like protein, partial [Baffinella frigidus]
YQNYCSDFGPVDLATVVSFCRRLSKLLNDPRLGQRPVVYYSDIDIESQTNAAFLMGAYLVVTLGWSPDDAAAPFHGIQPSPFKPFRDATDLPSDFDLTIRDCLRGLARGFYAGWFDLASFDVEQFKRHDNAGMSRICPTFIAYKGPADAGPNRPDYALAPDSFLQRFRHAGVSDIVQLNKGQYGTGVYSEEGIQHHYMPFTDCATPSVDIVATFLRVVQDAEGVVAVHCLAGLGRTGTLIGLWLMGKMGWGARECIGWMRIVRPGAVIGAQQHFLVQAETTLRGMLHGEDGVANFDASALLPQADEPDEAAAADAAIRAAQVTDALARRNLPTNLPDS